MWVRWLATVRSPRKSAAATSRFVRPSATRAATRCSAAVSPSSRVRPPMRPSSRARLRRPSSAAPSSLEAVERRLDRVAGARASAARACGRRRARAAREHRRTDRRPPRAARPPARGAMRRESTSPSAAATRPRQRVTCASTHSRPSRAASASQTSRSSHRVVDPAELEQRLDVVGRPPADARLAPPERRACRSRLLEPLERPRTRLRSRGRRAPGPPGAAADGARTAPRPARALAPSARGRARAARGGRRRRAIGRWSCGTSSPYWIEMSWARAA